ncbi:sensor domain-containing protein [Natrialba sp. PRR66]|uniref:sensor domain-containing protein n=1 Tax=Natrialba sp. PRR66 TaxID=3098146 RepID=UPI002B1E800F|nr:sensor domain-containing protein [Natrialba sp. PRR66]
MFDRGYFRGRGRIVRYERAHPLPERSRLGPAADVEAVAAERQTYRNLCYLLLAIPIGIVYQFGLTLGFLGAIFAVVLVGIPILLCTIVGARYLAAFERRLANRLLTTDIRRPADR